MKLIFKAILVAIPICVLASSSEKISCYVGDQDEVVSTGGFDYCHTTFHMKYNDKGYYGGYLYEDKPLFEDSESSNNGQCYMRGDDHNTIYIECMCYTADCNQIITLHQFMKDVLVIQ